MAADLSGVWAKIARAEEHLALLDAKIRAFIEGDPQPIALSIPYLDPDSGWYIVYGVVEQEPPPRLGVILGDVLHNVRSALDHLIWQLVLLRDKTPTRGNAFPTSFSEDDWKSVINSLLQGVSGPHRAIIDTVQPYQGTDSPESTYLGMLKILSNVDKHQIVHPVFGVILHPGPQHAGFRVATGGGVIVKSQIRHGARIDHGAEVMRALVEPREDDTEIYVDGDIPIDIAFGDRLVPWGHLKNLPQVARVIVREFEPDFA